MAKKKSKAQREKEARIRAKKQAAAREAARRKAEQEKALKIKQARIREKKKAAAAAAAAAQAAKNKPKPTSSSKPKPTSSSKPKPNTSSKKTPEQQYRAQVKAKHGVDGLKRLDAKIKKAGSFDAYKKDYDAYKAKVEAAGGTKKYKKLQEERRSSKLTINKDKDDTDIEDSDADIDESDDAIDNLKDLDIDVIKAKRGPRKGWNPDKVSERVAQQWNDRLDKDKNFKPRRLKIDVKTPARLKKYTDDKGKFNAKNYIADVRSDTADYASKRGLKGDTLKALQRSGPKVPEERTPKYGGVIRDLKNRLGKIDHKKLIAKTSDKLTGDVSLKSAKFKKTGLDIIKPRTSEDGAMTPSFSEPVTDRPPKIRPGRRKRMRQKSKA